MRRKKERSKQGQTNKTRQATQHTCTHHENRCTHHENRSKQSNTAHPRRSFFLIKMTCLGWHDTLHSRQSALPLSYIYIRVGHLRNVVKKIAKESVLLCNLRTLLSMKKAAYVRQWIIYTHIQPTKHMCMDTPIHGIPV